MYVCVYVYMHYIDNENISYRYFGQVLIGNLITRV